MKKFILSLLLFIPLGIATSCSSSEYDVFASLYGVVTDASTGEPIAGASVQLSPGGATQITGSDGYFQYSDITPMLYTITVQKEGYSTNRKSVTVNLGENNQANITLSKINN